MSKEKEGKGCMVCMNVLLLVLAILAGAGCVYITNSKDVPPVVESLKGYTTMVMVVCVFVAVFAILGLCASCGGCFLFFYAVVMNIISLACIIVSIAFIALFVMSKKVVVLARCHS